MQKILFSGFEAFDGDNKNPTEKLCHRFSHQTFKNCELKTIVLPVTFEKSFSELQTAIDSYKPDIIILSGVAKNRKKISLEKMAINWIDARIPDNNNQLITQQKIHQNGLDGIFSSLNVEAIKETLNDINWEISYSAGTYVCNYLYYQVLHHYKIPTVFVHVPGTFEMTGENTAMKDDELYALISNFIETCF